MSDAPIPSDHQFRAKWRWPDDVERFVRSLTASGYTLNVCWGKSPLGDVRVDADNAHDPDVVCDMKHLPFARNTFEATISDPPWKVPYFDRFRPFYECVRVTEVGGYIIVNAKWPCESEDTRIVNPFDGEDREALIIRTDNAWRDASIVAVHEKIGEQEALDRWSCDGRAPQKQRPCPNAWMACYTCGDRAPLDELPYESPHVYNSDLGRFCSAACMHEFEDWLGVSLTPVDEPCPHVHPMVRAEWDD